jgi:hypothetical protein
MIKKISISIIILTVTSLCISTACFDTWAKILQFTPAIFLAQIVIYNIYVKFYTLHLEKVKALKEASLAKQGTYVKCPCHLEKQDFIPIDINGDNNYKCLHCNKQVAVTIDVKTFLTTQPLPLEGTTENLLKEAIDLTNE